MKVAIIEIKPILVNTIDAHVRNALAIAKYLRDNGHECIVMGNDTKTIEEKFDIVLFSYAPLYFDFNKYEAFFEINKDSEYVWLTNEYNLSMNSVMRSRVKHVIMNFIDAKDKYKSKLFVNLNTLIYNDFKHSSLNNKYDVCYYGTFRVNLEIYFRKYLKEGLILSTSTKNHKKFRDIGSTCSFTDKFQWKEGVETLRMFKASLYIEDPFTHTCFNHLANRFYEAVMCDCVLFFDESCRGTIEKSNCFIHEFFIVKSHEEMMMKIKSPEFESKRIGFLERNRKLIAEEKAATLVGIELYLKNILESDL